MEFCGTDCAIPNQPLSNFLLFRNLCLVRRSLKSFGSFGASVKHRLSYVSDIIRKGVIFY